MDPQAGLDPEPFETLFSILIAENPSNEQLSQAESLYNSCIQTDPYALVEKLVHLLERSPDIDVRVMSAILLRDTLLQKTSDTSDPLVWMWLPEKSGVKSCLLACVRNEQNKPIIKILSHTISKLAAGSRFPELMEFMLDGFKSVEWLKESALLIFAQLEEQYVKGNLVQLNLVQPQTNLHGVFKDCLENGDLRITALSAAIKFIQCLDYSERKSFKDLLPLMLKCVTEAPNEATARKALLLLKELAGRWPSFFTEQWTVILRIAEDRNLEERTRHLAIKVVITAAESRKCVWKQPIINRLGEILMRMLLDIEDEAAPHSAENEDEDAGRSSDYIFGNRCLHSLATALDWNTIVPIVYNCFSAPNHEWQKHLVGLVVLAQIAKRHSKLVEIPNLKRVLIKVVNLIASHRDHPRVILAAINAVGQLYANLDPNLQFWYHIDVLLDPRVRLAAINNETVQLFADLTDQQHETLLHTLHGAICDFNYPQVQVRAVSAMISIIINYPLDTRDIPPILHITVGTLVDELRRREEDIASDQTSIRAIRKFLRRFEARLPHETWTSTFNLLHRDQQAKVRSILAHGI